jgi:hypothetical protein
MGKKKQDPNPESGSGMDIPNHISERLETLGLKYLNSLIPGSGNLFYPGSGINIPDSQHCIDDCLFLPDFFF